MGNVITKDSGKREEFASGAVRDTQDGKARYDLIPVEILNSLQYFKNGVQDNFDLWQNFPITEFLPQIETREDLIPELALNRLGGIYARGALKYDEHNWKRGIPLSRYYASLFRHLIAWRAGDTSEDHLAAILFNAIGIMWTEWAIVHGELSSSLADAGPLENGFDPIS